MASRGMALMAAAVVVLAAAQLKLCHAADAVSASSAPAPVGLLPHCDTWCGNVRVPYPFGVTPGCSYPAPGFNLTCDRTDRHHPRLLLADGATQSQVVDIFPRNSTVRVINRAGAVNISRSSGRGVWSVAGMGIWDDGPFVLKTARANELVVIGCDVQTTLHGANGSVVGGCSSICTNDKVAMDNDMFDPRCANTGCCQAPVPVGRTSFDVDLRRLNATDGVGTAAATVSPTYARYETVYVFLAEADWFNRLIAFDMEYRHRRVEIPVLLGWATWPSEAERAKHAAETVGLMSWLNCTDAEAVRRICQSGNSECRNTGRGYMCQCAVGYDGNPYLPNGCQDVNECELPQEDTGCFGECVNNIGSFECRCPRGSHGNHTVPGGCVPSISGLTIGLSVTSGAALTLLVLGAIFVLRVIKQHRIRMLKQKFFNQNRGQLLQQLVSQRADIAERMIIPLEELEKSTNNFDQSRQVGKGGNGTVYKGILSDLHVVAIKKPNKEIQREIDEFINEVAILSQINHRNVVRLIGCCLETQIPLLVYEFISNGTLHDHLHKASRGPLSWKDRLRIAKETSKAIAYLHSSVSIPIIHRDIKSPNILLDDALTAKVSDFGASRYIPPDQTEPTTAVQGTRGYMDPMYHYNGRLTEKSDVYSFGVILIELLTRKNPSSYVSPDGDGLVAQFNALLLEGNLVQILDPQVVHEGGGDVEEIAALAASCLNLRGEDRPTMRQVEMALEAFEEPLNSSLEKLVVGKSKEDIVTNHLPITGTTNTEEMSRQYSLEKELLMSAKYPR